MMGELGPMPGEAVVLLPREARKDKLGTTLGFEYDVDAGQQIALLVRTERFLDGDDDLGLNESPMRMKYSDPVCCDIPATFRAAM
jgi:hypothetical protein